MSLLIAVTPINVNATENSEEQLISYTVSEELQEENLIKDRERILNEYKAINARIPTYAETKYVKKGVQYINPGSARKVGNQPAGGVRFSTGGGFYWQPSGGPNVSVSLGGSYAGVSVGISIGQRSTSSTGYYCTAPNKTNYFLLYSLPTYKVEIQEVWGRRVNQSDFEYLYTVYPKTFYRVELLAKKV